MKLHAVCFVGAFIVLIGAVLAKYSVSETERFYARFMVLGGIVLILMPSVWSCSGSQTAPTSTVQLSWASAPGCSPDPITQIPRGVPFGEVQTPGSATRTVYWLIEGGVLTTTFQQQFGSHLYLLCSVTSGGAK